MDVCPFCNGLRSFSASCPSCTAKMEDKGKVMDYYDEYSAYMDTDTLKQNDGFPRSLQQGECPHLINCPTCGHDEIILVQE
ncbi:hypothetical protein BIV59_21610 [Bacillus sp. MUM 13]|nr:hypothetical protein BIV59_21610 [Bacillus sp. MUM 13]